MVRGWVVRRVRNGLAEATRGPLLTSTDLLRRLTTLLAVHRIIVVGIAASCLMIGGVVRRVVVGGGR